MEEIKEQARKDVENVWENKLQNEFKEKVNQGINEILRILDSELKESDNNINQLFEDLDIKFDEEWNPKFNNMISGLKPADNYNNKFSEIKNINNDRDNDDNFQIFNEKNNYNKNNFMNKMNENKNININNEFLENNKYNLNYNNFNMNNSNQQKNINNQNNNNNFNMNKSYQQNNMNIQNNNNYNNFNINNPNQQNNNNFNLNNYNNINNQNNRNNQNNMNYQNNMNNQNNFGNQNRQNNNLNNMNNQNNMNIMNNNNSNWKAQNNMYFTSNDVQRNANNNDNIEYNELRKQKIDFTKFNNPPLITLVEPNNSNHLINLIFRCLSNILSFLPYYFNPSREEKILKKSKEDPNGVYLGPSFLKLLEIIWKSSRKEYCPTELHIALKKLMGNNYFSNNPGLIMEFILKQLDKELNFNPFVKMDDNDNHLNQNTSFKLFFKQFEKYSTKISNCSFTTIKTQKKCSSCSQSTYFFNSAPVVNIILEANDEYTNTLLNQFNLTEHLNNLLITKNDENIYEYCLNCKNQRKKYIMKEIFLTFSVVVFYINREKDPKGRISFNYPEKFDGKKVINKVFDLYNYQLITVIKRNPNELSNYIAYCKSFTNNKWYSYYKQNISIVENTNEIIDNKNACLLIYSEMKSQK